MDEDFICIQMEVNISDLEKMTINMEKELKLDQMEANILDIISLEKNMDKGNFNGQMARFIQENSLKIIYKDWDL